MAANDLILFDASASPQPFTPEVGDLGNSATTGKPVRRQMVGANDGAIISIGATADVPVAADTWSTILAGGLGLGLLRATKAMWRDIVTTLTGVLKTSEVAAAPVVGTNVVVLSAKATAGKFVHLQVVNDTTAPMFAVIEDTATTTAPASGVALAPVRVVEIPAGDGTISGLADHAVPFAFATGCRVLLSTTYRTYTPVAFTGLISASAI